MKDFKIWCTTKEERDAVLEKMKADGITFNGTNGKKPSSKMASIPQEYVGFIVVDNCIDCWVNLHLMFEFNALKEISPKEYLRKQEGKKMEELKELLEYAKIRKEKLIKDYYAYIMDCNRDNKEVCYFTLGRIQGKIDEQKDMIKVIEHIINTNEEYTQEDTNRYKKQDFQDVFDFLSRMGVADAMILAEIE